MTLEEQRQKYAGTETEENRIDREAKQNWNLEVVQAVAEIRCSMKESLPEDKHGFELVADSYSNATENEGREKFKPRTYLPYEKLCVQYNGKEEKLYFGWFNDLKQFKNAFIYKAVNFIEEC